MLHLLTYCECVLVMCYGYSCLRIERHMGHTQLTVLGMDKIMKRQVYLTGIINNIKNKIILFFEYT